MLLVARNGGAFDRRNATETDVAALCDERLEVRPGRTRRELGQDLGTAQSFEKSKEAWTWCIEGADLIEQLFNVPVSRITKHVPLNSLAERLRVSRFQ